MDYNTIDVLGVAHWSARGSIDSEMWEWGLLIDEKRIAADNHLQMQTEKAANFVKDLKPNFPDDYEDRMVHPVHIPGDCLGLRIPLSDFKNPDAVYSILRQYFPKDIKE